MYIVSYTSLRLFSKLLKKSRSVAYLPTTVFVFKKSAHDQMKFRWQSTCIVSTKKYFTKFEKHVPANNSVFFVFKLNS